MDVIDIETRYIDLNADYDALFDETLPNMHFDDKRLKEALKEQIPLLLKWELMHKKIALLYDDSEIVVDEVYSSALQKAFKADKYREISISEAKDRAKADATYLTARKIQNKIRALRDESKGILETVVSRKYIINGFVNSMVAHVEDNVL